LPRHRGGRSRTGGAGPGGSSPRPASRFSRAISPSVTRARCACWRISAFSQAQTATVNRSSSQRASTATTVSPRRSAPYTISLAFFDAMRPASISSKRNRSRRFGRPPLGGIASSPFLLDRSTHPILF